MLGERIREIFLEDTNECIDPITEAFLLYASRKHLDQNILRKNSTFRIGFIYKVFLIKSITLSLYSKSVRFKNFIFIIIRFISLFILIN